jgi:hypothetical protein
MALADLIADASLDEVATFLDALEPDERWAAVSRLDRRQQRALYDKADPHLDLGYLVAGAGPLTEVIHDGVNTLPVARRFQKRFCRPGDGTAERLYGYNEGPTRRLIGPGYFVAVPDGPGVLVDYHQVPDGPVVPGWPAVVPNSKGLQRFVFHLTRDRLRRVSAHVSVGAAYKRDRPLDQYFILCRRAG